MPRLLVRHALNFLLTVHTLLVAKMLNFFIFLTAEFI